MKVLFCVLILGISLFSNAQDDKYRKQFADNQEEIDNNYGGIGFKYSRPTFGKATSHEAGWFGFDLVGDFIHLNYSVGKIRIEENFFDGIQNYSVGDIHNGREMAIGALFPIPAINFGYQANYLLGLRGHPVAGIDFGQYKFWRTRDVNSTANIWFLRPTVGYRLRLPVVSVEVGVKARLGADLSFDDNLEKGLGVESYFTLRFDAFKMFLAPNTVTTEARKESLSNIKTSTTSTTSRRYTPSGVYDRTTTTRTTTADVNVSSTTFGYQDIGNILGIGVRYGFNNFRREPFINRGNLFGVGAHYRRGMMTLGLNIDGGRVGHGSGLDRSKDGFKNRLDPNATFANGYINTLNTTFDVGFDISDFIIGLSGTFTEKESYITSYFAATVGYSAGFSTILGDQQYDENLDLEEKADFKEEWSSLPGKEDEKFYEASESKSGYLGGFYLALELGALQAKVQRLKYSKAPLLNNTWFTLTYRVPIRL